MEGTKSQVGVDKIKILDLGFSKCARHVRNPRLEAMSIRAYRANDQFLFADACLL